jgi:mutator protein MutT
LSKHPESLMIAGKMTYVQVAIGVIVESGRMLVCQRPAGGSFAGLWEFPGGKLLPDVSATACLHRELEEELGITVSIAAPLAPISHDYDDLKVTLHPFIATLLTMLPAATTGETSPASPEAS